MHVFLYVSRGVAGWTSYDAPERRQAKYGELRHVRDGRGCFCYVGWLLRSILHSVVSFVVVLDSVFCFFVCGKVSVFVFGV